MKTSTGFAGVLAFLAVVDVASARASARASLTSAGGILRDSSPKQYDGLAMPQLDAKLGLPAKIEGGAAKAAAAVTGGQHVKEVTYECSRGSVCADYLAGWVLRHKDY